MQVDVTHGMKPPPSLEHISKGPSLTPASTQAVPHSDHAVAERYAAAAEQREEALCCPVTYQPELLARLPDEIIQELLDAFNPASVSGVMCRKMIFVGWDGRLFDCDFNQMLELATNANMPKHIGEFNFERLAAREIVVGQHCFGCTAGAGSGCLGAIDTHGWV